MATTDDRRAAGVLLLLALLGLGARALGLRQGAPGAVAVRSVETARPALDSLSAIAGRLGRPLAAGERIDLDRAAADELTRLPRVGPVLATRIVRDREERGPFGALHALERVAGVGPALLAALEPHVRFSGRPSIKRPQVGGPAVVGEKVSLNTARAERLAQLPGIGPVRARAIVEYRERNGPFRTVDDLVAVRGIGRATVARLRGAVRVP